MGMVKSTFVPGHNCWRVAKADKFALIVDAADYFRVLRKVFAKTQRELFLIGWDFDFEIEMLPGESDADGNAPDGLPNKLGPFVEAIVDKTPTLHVYMLKWNGALVAAPGRVIPSLALYISGNDRIHFALDGHHPFGACHHQKIIVADDSFAFCGGIDVTEDRWDTPEHLPNDPRRTRKNGSLSEPWHDASSAMTGDAACALAEMSRIRWHRATGETLKCPTATPDVPWPSNLDVDAQNVDIAIARTEPPYDGHPLIHEVEQLFLDSIAMAKDVIYIESQYFAAESLCDALEARLREEDGPEIVVINPDAALSELEDSAMHVLRTRMIDQLSAADHQDRFRIYYPVTRSEEPIYVHAKIMIIDDRILRLGSSNFNDRSLGFDTECDVALEGQSELVSAFRKRLICEHLDVSPDKYDRASRKTTSLIALIEALNAPEGRGLRKVEPRSEGYLGKFLADTRFLDPRYFPGQPTPAGKGVRPRHLAMLSIGALVCFLLWQVIKRWV